MALARILDLYAPPGSHVLVFGSRAGGEVRACLHAGCNVVAIEQDAEQFVSLISRMQSWNTNLELAFGAEQAAEGQRHTQHRGRRPRDTVHYVR